LITPLNQKVLAEIHLFEQDWQAAIELARQQSGYGQEDIKTLVAEGVKQFRPEAAIELYKSLVEFNTERSNRKYYKVAAHYAAQVRDIYLKIRQDRASWLTYLNQIRAANSRRPALLDEFKVL
jgi:uncharacterized Zn finger protein